MQNQSIDLPIIFQIVEIDLVPAHSRKKCGKFYQQTAQKQRNGEIFLISLNIKESKWDYNLIFVLSKLFRFQTKIQFKI